MKNSQNSQSTILYENSTTLKDYYSEIKKKMKNPLYSKTAISMQIHYIQNSLYFMKNSRYSKITILK